MKLHLNHRFLRKIMYRLGKGKAKIYIEIIAILGNTPSWKPLDRDKVAKKTKFPVKQVNKAIRKMKKANIIRYKAGRVKYSPLLLSRKGVLLNKVKAIHQNKKEHRHHKLHKRLHRLFHHKKHKKK